MAKFRANSIAMYETAVAWVGMVLVDQDYRGGGIGKTTFQAALNQARGSQVAVIGLDATDLGEPI